MDTQMYTYDIVSYHYHYLFGSLLSRNAKETHTDQSILNVFTFSEKKGATSFQKR